MEFKWNAFLYDQNHNFVYKYGEEVLMLLSPQKNETILDLGCGTGNLTFQISQTCKKVIGIDQSIDMINQAKNKYSDIAFILGNALDFRLEEKFDAIFSNAVLHWIPNAETVIRNIAFHLNSNGRFVAEFGGKGCVNKIISTLTDILDEREIQYTKPEKMLYYPTIGEYTGLLEKNGFVVTYAILFDRETELNHGDEGLKNWLDMFVPWIFSKTSHEEKAEIIEQLEQRLKPILYKNDRWYADYRRIRVIAVKG